MSSAPSNSPTLVLVPSGTQAYVWCLGMIACVPGMLGRFLPWDQRLATIQLIVLLVAPLFWMARRQTVATELNDVPAVFNDRLAWWLAIGVGLTSLATCFCVGNHMADLPPFIHDEYSYLFQAKTLLLGSFSVPSHPTHAELFNQMHVLNEGRMASRYYPGTGLWLAPFVVIGHPYWGHWLASAISSIFVFWTGYELGRLRVAVVSGFVFALSPGVALFGNMLLAHQPTLVGLTIFLWAFVKWQRTRSPVEAFVAGCGLSYAMLCRPATAAGFGLPFGLAFVYWLVTAKDNALGQRRFLRAKALFAMGLPLLIGWCVMVTYHQDVTGSWRTSPYQLYTDIYTPRHVYGFNNVLRGEKKLGPKVVEAYDRWADNLTPKLATENVVHRLFSSWLWTFDLLPQFLSSLIILGPLSRLDRRWWGVVLAILSLHAIHVPYWVAGILGWHYVFETCILWCLLLGLGTDLLFRSWCQSGHRLMPAWWSILLLISVAGVYLPTRNSILTLWDSPRIRMGIDYIHAPRQQYADFNQWLGSNVTVQPALVLIEIDPDEVQIDYVVNSPKLDDTILRGRYRPGVTYVEAIARAFPDRAVYVCQPKDKSLKRLTPSGVDD